MVERTKFAIVCLMLPKDGKREKRLHHKIYDTIEEAQAACDSFRRQILPFDTLIAELKEGTQYA